MLKRNPRNRRIYDTVAKRYVTVKCVRRKLLEGEKVFCHVTSAEVTALYLQALIKADINQGTGPTPEALRQFILTYVSDAVSE